MGRGALAEGVGRLARGRGIRPFGIGAHVVGRVVVVAGGLEIAVAGGGILQLAEVDRIGRFGARRHVGHLAFGTRVAHRDRALAIGDGIGTERDAVVGVREGVGPEGHAVVAVGGAVVAERDAVRAAGPGFGTHRRGAVGL